MDFMFNRSNASNESCVISCKYYPIPKYPNCLLITLLSTYCLELPADTNFLFAPKSPVIRYNEENKAKIEEENISKVFVRYFEPSFEFFVKQT